MSAIIFDAVSKKYQAGSDQSLHALRDVCFDVKEGEFFGLLGPNGAGKTTLISVLSGLLKPTSGSVRVHGHDVQHDALAARQVLGVVPQEIAFDPFFSVYEALRMQAGYFGFRQPDAWIEELLHNLGLSDKAHANMRSLSGGMKRRVMVAQALVHKPRVIVLDEPTAGVDVQLRQTLWQFISKLNQQGHTVLLTTHYLEEAEALCSRVAMLKKGEVVALERTADLLSASASQVLRFALDGALPPDLSVRARVTGRIVQVPVTHAQDIEDCLAQLRQAGLQPESIEIRKLDLEDVFLQVMNRQLPSGSH